MYKKIGVLVAVVLMAVGTCNMAFAADYVVKDGDVLWKIAKENGVTIDEMVKANGIKNPNLIYVNQVLKVPEKEEENKMTSVANLTNSEKAVALIESLGTHNTAPVAYINPSKYVQHNLAVADGLAGFGAVVAQLPEGTYGDVKRVISDGDYVVLQSEYNFFGPKIGFDIFRFEDGLIVEHWDNLTEIAKDVNPSGRGQIDGTTVVTDLDKTESNKAVIKGFVGDVLMGAAPEKVTDYISQSKYYQHNTMVADGLDGLGAALTALAEAGTPMIYEKNHFVLGEGNFVLAASEGTFLGKHVAFYDLFRIEDGLIVEHWDVIEEIPSKDTWMNQNGKF